MSQPTDYSRAQIVLHWVTALCVLALYVPISHASGASASHGHAVSFPMTVHLCIGLALLPLIAWRLWLRQARGVPQPESLEPELLRGVGRCAHLAMYGLLVLLPLSGAAVYLLADPWVQMVHEVGRVLLLGLVGMHSVAALMHHYALRNGALHRMLSSRSPEVEAAPDWRRTKCTLKS